MWMMRNHATNGISVWIRRGLATLLALCLVMGSVGALADAILKQGSQGEAVRRLQERLIELCYLAQGDAEDGVYDEITEAAILLFQERNHLMETGMADEVTQSVLYSDAAVSNEYVPSEEEWLFGEPCEEAMDGFFLTSAMYAFMPASGVAWNTEEYTFFHENGFQSVSVSPLSTFAADVDTSAYAQLRSKILRGEAVPPDSVRVEEAKRLQEEKGGFIKTMWCGDLDCELKMKDEAGMSSRCIPFDQEHLGDTCAICGRAAKKMIYWGVAY